MLVVNSHGPRMEPCSTHNVQDAVYAECWSMFTNCFLSCFCFVLKSLIWTWNYSFTVCILSLFREFDREKSASYSFEAFATDGGVYGPRSRMVRVDVIISDVNDNAPIFDRIPYKADIPQDFPVGQVVLTITATDKDSGRNGQLLYSMLDTSQYFQLDAATGQITTKRLLDIAAIGVHTLKVKATDRANLPKNSTGSLNSELVILLSACFSWLMMACMSLTVK